MNKNNIISFSFNWNNKLSCKTFTTLRIYNPVKYIIGKDFIIEHPDRETFNVKLISSRKLYLKDLNDWITYIDTGYNIVETEQILRKMYKHLDMSITPLHWLLLKRI